MGRPPMGNPAARLFTLSRATFPAQPVHIRLARVLVADTIADHPRINDALLLTTELATNAVTHGAATPGFAVTIKANARTTRIEITVPGGPSEAPVLQVVDHQVESGRGLYIVDRLADAWGYTRDSREAVHTTWFELDTPATVNPADEPKRSAR